MGVLEGMNEMLIDGGTTEHLLILEFGRQVDAVVLTYILHGFWWQFLGLRGDTHGFKDMQPGLQIASERPW
jgi:hypothetical protein